MTKLDDIYQQANIAAQNNENEKAINLYETIIKKFPDTDEAQYAEININNLVGKIVNPYANYNSNDAFRFFGVPLIYSWQFIPIIPILLSNVFAIIFLMLGFVIIWSILGLVILFSSSIFLERERKLRVGAIVINSLGIISWTCIVIYCFFNW